MLFYLGQPRDIVLVSVIAMLDDIALASCRTVGYQQQKTYGYVFTTVFHHPFFFSICTYLRCEESNCFSDIQEDFCSSTVQSFLCQIVLFMIW